MPGGAAWLWEFFWRLDRTRDASQGVAMPIAPDRLLALSVVSGLSVGGWAAEVLTIMDDRRLEWFRDAASRATSGFRSVASSDVDGIRSMLTGLGMRTEEAGS